MKMDNVFRIKHLLVYESKINFEELANVQTNVLYPKNSEFDKIWWHATAQSAKMLILKNIY